MRTGICFLLMVVCGGAVAAQDGDYIWVFLNTNPNRPELPKEQVDSLQAGHMANISRLANEKKLVAAGPFYGGGGIFVFATSSVDSTNRWLGTDPAIRAGRFVLEVFPYRPRIGSICSVGEDFEMTTYSFVRYKSAKIDSAGSDAYWSFVESIRDSVVAEGLLGGGAEWILVTRHQSPETIVARDPAVAAGRVTAVAKKLYIASGAFCEE